MSLVLALESVALIAASIYAGAAYYIATVEQPSRLGAPRGFDLELWQRANDRAPRYAASALVGAAAALLVAWQARKGWPWALGAVLLLAVLPWTVLTMLPIQRRLGATQSAGADTEARLLVERWGHLHLGRVALGVCALALFLGAVLLP